MSDDAQIQQWRQAIDRSLLGGMENRDGDLTAAIHYALSVKGKRLRPLLFLSLIQAHGRDPLPYMDVAVAIEYIHTYSLIHDDLPAMDDDDFRRGMPTVHKKFGEAIALLAGDTLLTMAFEKIAYTPLPPPVIVQILQTLTTCIGRHGMAGGQALDLAFSGNRSDIYKIHRLKTAELIRGTLISASEILGYDASRKRALGDAGTYIGVAFQLADDLLDIEGDEAEVGKKLHKDARNRSPNSVLYWDADHVRGEIDRLYRQTLQRLKEIGIGASPFLNLIHKMAFRSK